MSLSNALLETSWFDGKPKRGKVRDTYDLGDMLLIIATDRISAYDVIMPNGIPEKGKILTQLSIFWFKLFAEVFSNHFISKGQESFPWMIDRTMLVKKASVYPIECIARGFNAGSGWKEYQKSQTICGIKLPPGLRQCEKLPQPIFTPSTKAEQGQHDENITFEKMVEIIGEPDATILRERTLSLYSLAAAYAANKGIIIADTKFEFGKLPSGEIILIDEVLTPDSSRFWPADEYEPGHDQPSFDKQFVRNYLESQPWDKTPPAPELPLEVVLGTYSRYVEAYERLTGNKWPRSRSY